MTHIFTADAVFLTPREVANLFRVDPKTVTRWADRGLLETARTPGGHRRILESSVVDLLNRDARQ
jgi:excisionase family DNA binding protein